jgi:dipeptidase D
MGMSASMPGLVENVFQPCHCECKERQNYGTLPAQKSCRYCKEIWGQHCPVALKTPGQKHLSRALPGLETRYGFSHPEDYARVYKEMYGKEAAVKAIHAGLECGILGGIYPSWDMISFGPTLRSPHSPDERCYVPSVQKFWDLLVETLKNIE